MTFQIPVSSVPLLQDSLFVLVFVWLGTAIGRRTQVALRAPLGSVTALERGVLCAAVGLGLLQFVPLVLGLARILTPTAVMVSLVALLVLFFPDMRRVGRGIWRVAANWRSLRFPGWIVLGSLLCGIVLAFKFVEALTPPTDYDGVAYHLAAPRWWLEWHNVDFLPTMVHTNSPMGVEMLFTFPLAFWSDTAAKLIHYALGVLTLLAIFVLGRRLRNQAVGFLAAALFFLLIPNYYILFEYAAAYVDLGTTFELVCAVLAWLLWSRTSERGWFFAAALCAGFAACFKLPLAFTGVVMAILVVVWQRQDGVPLNRALREGAVFLLVSLLPVFPWLLRSGLATGNPVWPMMARIFPTRDWSPEAGKGFTAYFRYYNWGGQKLQHWSLGQKQLLLDGVMALTLLGSALLIWCWRDREAKALTGILAGLLLIALWTTGLFARFFTPFLPLVYLLLLLKPARTIQAQKWVHALVVALLLVGTAKFVKQNLGGLRLNFAVATGRLDRETYLETHLPITKIWAYANKNLPPDSRILQVGFTGSYYSRFYCYGVDSFGRQRIHLDTFDDFVQSLQRDHITHLIMTGDFDMDMRPDAPTHNQFPFAKRLVAESGSLLYAVDQDKLYRLDISR